MSQYVNFFIRANEVFLPLFSFSRNGYMYAAFHTSAPYGKISAITAESLKVSQDILLDQIDSYQKRMRGYESEKQLVPTFDNTVDEKLDSIRNIDNIIDDLQSELDELGLALNYCTVMHDILETARYGEKAKGVSTYKDDTLLYCGIEISNPSVADIV